jgi:checkpoint serine/threonine-protein kinase
MQAGVEVDTNASTVATLSEAAKCVSKGGKRAAAGVKVTLGNISYVFKGRVGEGAHAEVYEAELASKAQTSNDEDIGAYAVKVQESRYAKWEFVIAQPTALHLLGGQSSDGDDATMGALVMPFGEHGTLQDVLNSYLRDGKQMHETLVMYYAVEMLRLVEWIHGAGIVHADLKPDNLLLRNGGEDWCDWAAHRPGSWTQKGLALIDFGRAIDLTMYPEEAAFVGDAGAEAFRCIEMMNGKPWTYQADCYAIASTIHCLLYGSYMDVELTPGTTNTYRQRQPLRRYWKTELWEVVFDRLLNQPTESTPPPLGSLRAMLEERMRGEGQNIRKLLMHQTIDMYQQIRDGKVK